MKYRKWIFGGISVIVFVSFFIYKNSESLEVIYIKLFKKTLSIVHKNAQGKLDGEAIFYKNGNKATEANFVSGLKNGWALTYYKSGHIQNKIFYKDDKEDGKEYEYYENGNLHYEGIWIKGKRFGSLFYYDETGGISIYHAYDILGHKFNAIWFDQSGNVTNDQGHFVSGRIYSFNSENNSLTLLNYKKSYTNINDLYITVATPPKLYLSIFITVNGIELKGLSIINNTVKISNIFNKNGTFNIVIS
jgi:hypothetical protein